MFLGKLANFASCPFFRFASLRFPLFDHEVVMQSPPTSHADENARTIKLIYFFTFCSSLSRAIYEGNVLSTYVYLITDQSNLKVGELTGVSGLSQLIAAPCVGYATDKWTKVGVLRLAFVTGIIAISYTLFSIYTGNYENLLGSMIIWGLYWCATQTTLGDYFCISNIDR